MWRTAARIASISLVCGACTRGATPPAYEARVADAEWHVTDTTVQVGWSVAATEDWLFVGARGEGINDVPVGWVTPIAGGDNPLEAAQIALVSHATGWPGGAVFTEDAVLVAGQRRLPRGDPNEADRQAVVTRVPLASEGEVVVRNEPAWLHTHVDGPEARGLVPCGDLDDDGHVDLCVESRFAYDAEVSEALVVHGPWREPLAYEDIALRVEAPVSDGIGFAAAGGHDLDRDGAPDVAFGAIYANEWDGGVYLLTEAASPGSHRASDLRFLPGEPGKGQAGASLASSADLTGDGRADLVVGAHLWDDRTGRVYVLDDLDSGLAGARTVIDMSRASSFLGYATVIADLDRDGVDDLAVSAPGDHALGGAGPGVVAVFLGPLPEGHITVDDADSAFTSSTPQDGDGFGYDLAVSGHRLVVGAPFQVREDGGYGTAYLFDLADTR